MPVSALIPHPWSRRRRPTRLLAPVVLAGALVAGVLPAVAHADPITFTAVLSDSFVPVIPDLDITSVYPGITLGNSPPPRGQAHLFDRDSGRLPMTDAQYAGMTAMEDEANAAVRAYHRMSDTPNNHDLVVMDDRPELLAALYARLRQAAFDDTPTPAESAAVGWLVGAAQDHAIATATAAKAEFDTFDMNDGRQTCSYRPPAPFTDWPSEEAVTSCRPLLPGEVPGPPVVPETGQFAAWGDIVANPYTPSQTALLGNTSAAAVAWGASLGSAGGAAASLAIAQALTRGGLTTALRPFATRVATTLVRPALLTAAETAYAAEGAVDTSIAAERALVTTAQLGQSAARFTPLLAAVDVAGIALIVAAAIVEAVMAGIDYTKADAVGRDLDQAISNARNSPPDLRELLSSDSGKQQVLLDLTTTVLDCNAGPTSPDVQSPNCNVHPDLPTRLPTDPVFQLATSDDSQAPAITTSIPVTIGRAGHPLDSRLTIRDGWLLVDGIPTPLTQFPYVDQLGQTRIAKLVNGGNGYLFQSERELSSDTASDTGTAYDPAVQCVNGYDRAADCYLTELLPMTDSAGNAVYLNQLPHRPAPAATLTVTSPAVVGQLVTLGTVGGPLTSYDGVAVHEGWTVESDGRCVYTRPDDFSPTSCSTATPGDGPHGGWLDPLPGGATTTTWNEAGTWRITQTRTDDYGVVQSTSTDVTVLPATASLAASCTAPCAAAPGGAPVTVTGSISSGAAVNGEAVTVDWGDGTTTTGVPSSVVRAGTIAPGMTATRTSSVAETFTATHSYTSNINGAPIRVSALDSGDGNPAPVSFVPATPPVADSSSYGNASGDTPVGFAKVEFRTPVFRDASGAVVRTSCTSLPGGVFPVGTTPVTCSATNAAGTSSVMFSVTVHAYTLTLVPSATTVRAGSPVTFVPHGYTDDGRDIGPITDQGVVAEALSADTTCDLLTCSRTSSWGSILVYPVIGDLIVGGNAEVYTVPALPAATAVTAGDAQSAPVGTTLPSPLSVVVRDAYGNLVPGAPVTFTVTSGDAGVGAGLARTVLVTSGPDGQASRALALGTTPGPVVVTATTPGASASTFHVSGVTGPLQGVSGNGQQAVIGRPAVPLAVRVTGTSGAPVAGVPVTFTVTGGGATLGGGATVTVPSGADGTASASPVLGTTEGPVAVDVQAGSYGRVSLTFSVVKNSPPTALARSWSTTAGAGPLVVAAPGVLTGARDAQGDPLTAVLVKKPGHGTLTLRPDGSFSYVPNAAYAGSDSFTWRASDGSLSSPVKTVTLNVLAANADLATTLVAPTGATRGSQVQVTVTLSDRGPSTGQLVAGAVQLPTGMKVVKAPASFTISKDGRTAQVSLPSLPYGTTRTFTLLVSVDKASATGDRAISAAVSSLTLPDPAGGNNTARAVVRVR